MFSTPHCYGPQSNSTTLTEVSIIDTGVLTKTETHGSPLSHIAWNADIQILLRFLWYCNCYFVKSILFSINLIFKSISLLNKFRVEIIWFALSSLSFSRYLSILFICRLSISFNPHSFGNTCPTNKLILLNILKMLNYS